MPLTLEANCLRDFFPAAHNSGPRAASVIRWIVLHDEEAPTAASAARYFQEHDSGGSTHLCVDGEACYRCLEDGAIPWGAISSFGANIAGFHIEQAGYARWSAVVWQRHRKTLERAAFKTAQACKRLHVPPVFVTAGQLPEHHGVTTHREVSAASRRFDPANRWLYSHSDPGPFWPRRYFMRRVVYWHARI